LYRLPWVGGQVLDDAPPLVYDSPFMSAELGSAQVMASAQKVGVDLTLLYDFERDIVEPKSTKSYSNVVI